MLRTSALLFLFAAISQAAPLWVTGNVQGNTSETFPTILVPCAKYTHITHYAANPGAGGTVVNGSLSPSENSALVAACHAVGTKVLFSLFDPGGGGAFVTATNSTNLSTFVANTVAYMNTYGYDGVDLDWEGTLVTSQYNAYIVALRAAIGAGKLITMNAYPGGGATPLTTAAAEYPNLDQINIMAYDADLFVSYTWHNAAIASTNGDTTHPTDAVELGQFLAAGIPAAKLGMGFPFYGRHYTGTDAPLQPRGTPVGAFSQYSAISTNSSIFNPTNYRWDSTFQADYLSLTSTNEFYTYNGVGSINAFVPWVKSQNLGGIMVYQVNYEFISSASGNARYPLSTAMSSALATTGVVCNNNSGDPALINSAFNAGGTVTVSGVCAMGSSQITMSHSVVVNGGTYSATSTFNDWTFIVTSDNVSFNGSTFINAGLRATGAWNVKRTNFNFTNCTFRDFTAAAANKTSALAVDPIWRNSTFKSNTCQNIWVNGYPDASNLSQANTNTKGLTCIVFSGGLDNTQIENNIFTQILNDGIHGASYGTGMTTGGYTASGVSISYNKFNHVHRIGIEYQNCLSAQTGVNCVAQVLNSGKIAGNSYITPAFIYLDTYAYSLPVVCSTAGRCLYINNTGVQNITGNSTTPQTRAGFAMEMPPGGAFGGGHVPGTGGYTVRGNVFSGEANPADGSNPGWFPTVFEHYSVGSTSMYDVATTYQNNFLCGPGGNTNIGADSFNIDLNNWKNTACPISGASLTVSNMASAWTSANNQSFPSGGNGTWAMWVTNNVSNAYADFFIDSSTTAAFRQELTSTSGTFSTDRRWPYSYTFNTTTLASGTHTIHAVVTDSLGTTFTTSNQTFTVGGGGTPSVTLLPTSLAFGTVPVGSSSSPQVVTLTNTGTATLNITSIVIAGANAADYSNTTTCTSTLAASSNCTITVTFSPLSGGSRTANVSITDNAIGSPHSVPLTGTGAAQIISGCGYTTGTAGIAEGTTTAGTPCTVTLAVADHVTLAGAGSIACAPNCTTATSVVFTPPASVQGTAIQGGCPMAPIDSIFNIPAQSLPVHASSATWMAQLATIWPTSPFAIAPAWSPDLTDNTTPTTQYSPFFYTTTLNGVDWPNPFRPAIGREGGTQVFATPNVDHHWSRVNRQTCQVYETYNDGVTAYAGLGCPTCKAGSGFTVSGNQYDLPTDVRGSTEAAGGYLTPKMLTLADVMGQTTPHVLYATLGTGGISNSTHLWPATQNNGSTCTNCPPYGAIFRMSTTWCAANLASFSGYQHNIMLFLCHGGMMLSDAGSGPLSIAAAADVYGNTAARAAVNALSSNVSIGAFTANMEIVDQSSLMVAAGSSRVDPANSAGIVPASYSVLSMGSSDLPIAVQPIAIGTPYQAFGVLSGAAAVPLQSWVNGAASQSVTWTVQSGTGTVSGSNFTAPSGLTSPETDILQGVAAADANAKILVSITVLPADGAHSGVYAIAAGGGAQCGTPTCSRLYQAEASFPQKSITWFPNSDSTGFWTAPDAAVWSNNSHDSANGDGAWGPIYIANGNYNVTFGSGQVGCASTYQQTSFNNSLSLIGTLMLEGNGQIGAVTDFGYHSGSQCRKEVIATIPVTVTNHWLTLGMHSQDYAGNTGMTSPSINLIQVDLDTGTTPHWAVDGQGQGFVPLGSALQFRQVDYFTQQYCAGPDQAFSNATCTWSVPVGPGTISAAGLYTAPSALTKTASVTVQVTNGTYTATYGFFVPGNSYPVAVH